MSGEGGRREAVKREGGRWEAVKREAVKGNYIFYEEGGYERERL